MQTEKTVGRRSSSRGELGLSKKLAVWQDRDKWLRGSRFGNLLQFPVFKGITQSPWMDNENVTDIFEGKIPMPIRRIDPLFGLLEQSTFVGFFGKYVRLETVHRVL